MINANRVIEPEELLPDGELILSFVIPGQPATKKTSQRILGHRILPSKAYMAYEAHCKPYCEAAWYALGNSPLDFGVSVSLKVYLRSWIVGDATGYMQSIADILQKYGVVENDSWLSWDWAGEHWFGGVDKENPRVEIEIRRKRHPKEQFRAAQEEAERKKIQKRSARV